MLGLFPFNTPRAEVVEAAGRLLGLLPSCGALGRIYAPYQFGRVAHVAVDHLDEPAVVLILQQGNILQREGAFRHTDQEM